MPTALTPTTQAASARETTLGSNSMSESTIRTYSPRARAMARFRCVQRSGPALKARSTRSRIASKVPSVEKLSTATISSGA